MLFRQSARESEEAYKQRGIWLTRGCVLSLQITTWLYHGKVFWLCFQLQCLGDGCELLASLPSPGGLTRIGEALTASRLQLILPRDVEHTADYILLQINEPKTRFRAARHQVAKLDQPQLVKLVDAAFGHLLPQQQLWCYSGQTMRTRFQKLLEANKLDALPKHLARGIDLGSLRAGGASWLLMVSEDSELVRRRGRWINNKVMETYIQEASSLQFLPSLPVPTKRLIIAGAVNFPWILSRVCDLRAAQIPESAWPLLIQSEAVEQERNGWKYEIEKEAGGQGYQITEHDRRNSKHQFG
eukprot:s47_g37.t1